MEPAAAANACPLDSTERCPVMLTVRAGLHDLRNLACGIRGLHELLCCDGDDEAVAATLDDAIDRLLGEITALQHLAQGKPVDAHIRWVDLRQVLAAAVLTCALPDQLARIDSEVAAGCGLLTDPLMLHRVLANLLRNALEAAPAPARIHIRAQRREAGGISIRLCNPGELAIPAAPADSSGGRGLGLYAVRRVLADHLDGSLTLHSANGFTTALVELPDEPVVWPGGSSDDRRPQA